MRGIKKNSIKMELLKFFLYTIFLMIIPNTYKAFKSIV